MLNHPTFDKLHALRLSGMYHALVEQRQTPDLTALSFEERLGLLVDREMTERETRRLTTHLRQAKLRQSACLEDLDFRQPRGLEKGLMASLATCQWVRDHRNVLITGPTGVGKTWIACALGHQACRHGFTTLYLRLPRLLQELPIARGDGRYPKLMATLAKTGVIAPFPKLTSLDVGTHKGSSPTVWHNGRNQRVVAMPACHHFSAYGPAPSPLAWAPGLYSQTIFLASI